MLANNNYYIGIDLGGTRIKAGLVADGKLLALDVVPAVSAQGLKASLPLMQQTIEQLIHSQQLDRTGLSGIALAFPGLVDSVSQRILSTNQKYNDAIDTDLPAWVREQWQVPFFIDNDARMAAVGEWKFGAGQGTDDLVAMTIGTGVGSSAIINGRLLRGKHFQAGCLGGHMSIHYKGRLCNCGNIGCVEAHASTWSLQETILQDPSLNYSLLAQSPRLDFSVLFDAAEKKDQLAIRIQQECMDVWGTGVINLIHAYDPDVVVIGGGVMKSAHIILPYIQEKVARHAWTPWGTVAIRASNLTEEAGILGAVYSLRHQL
ncbi:MAG: ROK family protein [Chitinophagaceae bacterium]